MRDLKRRDDMFVRGPAIEERARYRVPIALKPSLDKLGRPHALQPCDVPRIVGEEYLVVSHARRDEHPRHPGLGVVYRHHPARKTVYAEIRLDRLMPSPSRITRRPNALIGDRRRAAQATLQHVIGRNAGPLAQLVPPDPGILMTDVRGRIRVALQMPPLQRSAAGEATFLRGPLPILSPRKRLGENQPRPRDQLFKLRIRLAEQNAAPRFLVGRNIPGEVA